MLSISVQHRFADVAAGTYSSFAWTADGHVLAWGLNNYGQLGLPGQVCMWGSTHHTFGVCCNLIY